MKRKAHFRKTYGRGRNFEYRVKAWYEQEGWTVQRSAGSHGLWDMVCVRFEPIHDRPYRRTVVKLVSCKRGGSWPTDERVSLQKLANFSDGTVSVVLVRSRGKALEFLHP